MYIYKITNSINNKLYIGQTSKTIEERFKRHCQDALSDRLDTHLARAIRKYGIENFRVEQIDKASTPDELNQKQQYWIHYYNTLKDGYNETDSIARSGGNTYAGRTEEQMLITKEKISKSRLGGNNPNATKVKCKNIKTDEELHFNSLKEMQNFFNEKNHNFITKRCKGETKCLYKQEWNIAYEENEYQNMTKEKNNRKAQAVEVQNLETQEIKTFPSYASAERYFDVPLKTFSGKAYRHKGQPFIVQNKFYIKILN